MKCTNLTRVVLLLALLAGTAGCDGFFDRPPEDQLTADNFYNTEADVSRATAALYNVTWFGWNQETIFVVGDARAGNLNSTNPGYQQYTNFTVTQSNTYTQRGWNSFYTTIGQANSVINNIRNSSGDISEEVRDRGIAEARFIRGYAYTYLAELWGAVPIVTSTADLIQNANVRRNTVEDVFQFALNDFEFAAENLPEDPAQPGRVSEWSAKGMLARTHFTLATRNGSGGSLDMDEANQARAYAEDVIANSDLELREDFGDLFLLAEEDVNNELESLFALQWTYEGNDYGTANNIQSFLAASSELTGFNDGWGGGTGVQGWLINLYADNDERRVETFMLDGDYYPELTQANGGYTYQGGNYYGNASAVKKYIIGTADDNDGRVAQQRTGIDVYMQRLPEIYLLYARTILGNDGSTSDPEALEYYNRVRERAGLAGADAITRDDLFNERWREFALEGRCWFFLKHLHNYDAQAARDFIRDQTRGYSTYYNDQGELVIEAGENYTPVQFTDDIFTLPYPETDVLQNPDFMEPPEEFDFSRQGVGGDDEDSGAS